MQDDVEHKRAYGRRPSAPGTDRDALRDAIAKVLAAIVAVCGTPSVYAVAAQRDLPIIVYHQIRNTDDGPPDSAEAIALTRFESEMRYLHEQGYVALSAQEVVNFVHSGKAPGTRIVAVQFDDGWKSAQLALPVLDRYGFKATFWIIAGKGIGWPHMDWDEIEAIAHNPRYDVYSQSMTHPWKKGDTMLDWMNTRQGSR